jgi:demethylmenaquinone methyltransferase/2-methoxy-6-polyprenyl-1,4-benzoquinol methylase
MSEIDPKSAEPSRSAAAMADGETVGSPLPAPEQKHDYVRTMFDEIAPRYDLLNSVLSARLHHGWRRAAVRQAALAPGNLALDVCTGTGDLALEIARRVGASGAVVGADFSLPMLRLGAQKSAQRTTRSGAHSVRWALADTQALPFPANTFDAVTVGFGIRNVADIRQGIAEMARVVRPGGRVVILEFSQPRNALFAALYAWYSFRLLPLLGGMISGRRSAYEYLPSSVAAFHSREALADMLHAAGLDDVHYTDLTFGTVVIHRGTKPRAGQVKP